MTTSDPIADPPQEPPSNQAAQQGSLGRDAELRQLVDHHFDFIWRLLRRLGVAEGDVDDAAQQVFVVAAEKLDQLDRARAREFLFGVAVRIAANARRTTTRRREVGEDPLMRLEHASLNPEEQLDRQKGLELLDGILQAMPVDLSVVLILTEIEEMSKNDVAAFLGVPSGTVASRLRRAREMLRASVQRSLRRPGKGAGTP